MGVRAIDVSANQGTIDWRAVRDSGVRGAWIRVGGADDPEVGTYRDRMAATNLVGAEAAGVERGTYYFCVPAVGDGPRQARHAVSVGHGEGRLWPWADIETNPHGLSAAQVDDFAREFCDEVLRLTGRESVIYTGRDLVGRSANPPRCPLAIANYGNRVPGTTPPNFSPGLPPAWGAWSIWQFNDVTRIPGVTANTVDQDVVTDEFWALMTAGAAAPARLQELTMKRLTHPTWDGIAGAEHVLVVDGNGVFRRAGISGGAGQVGVMKKGLDIDGAEFLTDEEAAWFASLTPVGGTPAEYGAFALTGQTIGQLTAAIRQAVVDIHTQDVDTDVDPATVADQVIADLGPKLAAIVGASVDQAVDAQLDTVGHALAD